MHSSEESSDGISAGDIVKIEPNRIGLISEVADGTIVRVGNEWFDSEDVEIRVLHRS